MSLINKRIKFLFFAIIIDAICCLFNYIDILLGLKNTLFLSVELIFAVIATLYLISKKEKFYCKTSIKHKLILIIPFCFTFLTCFSLFYDSGNYFNFLHSLVACLVSIVLEEMFFRSYAIHLFDEDGVVALSNVVYSIIVFAIANFAVIFFEPFNVSILKIVFSICFGSFLFGLYLSSKNAFLCMIASFLCVATELYFKHFSIGNNYFNIKLVYIFYIISMTVYFGVGFILILKNTVRK